MKYKNIDSAIHNFGHSFTSLMNYVDDPYAIDELAAIHSQGHDIEVDWLTGAFKPETLASPRIRKSIGYWRDHLHRHLRSHNVEPGAITQIAFQWPAGKRKRMVARGDRGKSYKMYINETKLIPRPFWSEFVGREL